MAYAAVISLKRTIQRLLNLSRFSIVSPSREIIKSAYKEVKSLQKVLKRLDECYHSSERMKVLEGEMRDAAHKLEDVIESHVSNQFLSQSESLGDEGCSLILSLDLQELRQDIDCFTQAAKKMKEEYMKELDNWFPEEEDDDDAVSSRTDFGGKMVGLSDVFSSLREELIADSPQTTVASIAGMAGIGKTTLAKKLFEDPLIIKKFECRAFVAMGSKTQLEEILQDILAQVNLDSDKMLMEGDENLDEYFWKSLVGRRYLIVLDNLWNTDLWDAFTSRLPGDEECGSQILVTTRLQQLAISISNATHVVRFLSKDESWDLFRGKVFAEAECLSQLEKYGKKIAENCEGLPLLILKVADLLSKAEKTLEYWNKVALDKENSIFITAYEQILEVLYPSYTFLPQHLKVCFLYMGIFPQNYEVRHSRLFNLWSAEGFLEPYPSQSLKGFAKECLRVLIFSSLVMTEKKSCYKDNTIACSLHSTYWYLCKKEARKNNFLHILNSHTDCLAEGMESRRRFSIYKNILFGIKDVYNSVASISTVRSLLCTGPHHQYQVPICFSLRLLRVLDVLTIRFYDFPMEALELVQLRYLALTYNGNLPPSISKLWNLQYLIVYQLLSIKSTVAPSYLPVEIWNLKELKYLQIMGRNLPDPCGAVLPNLLTLLDVGAHSCTKSVLESIPELNKLRVQIELGPDAAEVPLSCFDHIPLLKKLKSITCVVANPILSSQVVVPPPPLPIFPFRLKKLTLSGFGYPWKDMSNIAKLPFLKVLKLQCYAFRGHKWEAEEMGFLDLRCLLIEDTDLVQWTAEDTAFPALRYLFMRNCYKLQEIPYLSSLEEIYLDDCNPVDVTCAEQIGVDDCHVYDDYFGVCTYSSWDD